MTDFYVKMHKSLKSQIDVCKLCFTSVKANFCCSMLCSIFLAKRTTYLLHCNQNEKEVIFSDKLLLLISHEN